VVHARLGKKHFLMLAWWDAATLWSVVHKKLWSGQPLVATYLTREKLKSPMFVVFETYPSLSSAFL
jgi:hypothetical protein